MASKNSPNECWERNGYKIDRSSGRRQIINPNGEIIFDHGTNGYEDEMTYIIENGLLADE